MRLYEAASAKEKEACLIDSSTFENGTTWRQRLLSVFQEHQDTILGPNITISRRVKCLASSIEGHHTFCDARSFNCTAKKYFILCTTIIIYISNVTLECEWRCMACSTQSWFHNILFWMYGIVDVPAIVRIAVLRGFNVRLTPAARDRSLSLAFISQADKWMATKEDEHAVSMLSEEPFSPNA